MDLRKPVNTSAFLKKELKFKKRLDNVLASEDLSHYRNLVTRLLDDSNDECLDYVAALIFLNQPNLYPRHKKIVTIVPELKKSREPILSTSIIPKMIRYRVDVGQKHQVSEDALKNLFVEEAGVDKKMIGDVEMRHHYTLIDLPEGMPADIFQLLVTVKIQQQPLKIKRLKKRRFRSRSVKA